MTHETPRLALGDIRQPSWLPSDPVRVLAFDDVEVLYDGSWPNGSWTFRMRRRKSYYYRMGVSRFLRDSAYVRPDPLSAVELALYRPELPLRIYRENRITWRPHRCRDREDFNQMALANGVDLAQFPSLPVSSVVLVPSPLKVNTGGKRIDAENGKFFSALELLWHAYGIQTSYAELTRPGIGIYRLGLGKGALPSYIIGSYYEPNFSDE